MAIHPHYPERTSQYTVYGRTSGCLVCKCIDFNEKTSSEPCCECHSRRKHFVQLAAANGKSDRYGRAPTTTVHMEGAQDFGNRTGCAAHAWRLLTATELTVCQDTVRNAILEIEENLLPFRSRFFFVLFFFLANRQGDSNHTGNLTYQSRRSGAK